jgi:uncharacterized protein YdeI (BOF family)
MHRRLLALIATASLLSLPALADEHGNGHGRANTNIHTTTVMNGAVVRTHTVSNPAQTFTQTHVHKAKVKRHAHRHVVKTKVVTHHHHEERND